VGGTGSGKSTLSRALAAELGVAYQAKDELKEALMDALGPAPTMWLRARCSAGCGDGAVRLARGCPAAVIDSTWRPYAAALLSRAPGDPSWRSAAQVDRSVAEDRYRRRRGTPGHLDGLRDEHELWGAPVPPLGVGPLLEVDTTAPVDVPRLARRVRGASTQPRAQIAAADPSPPP
jgi:hypothetical protein